MMEYFTAVGDGLPHALSSVAGAGSSRWIDWYSDAANLDGDVLIGDSTIGFAVAITLTLTQVAVSGGNSVYSWSANTGPLPYIGLSVTITGFATGGNNVTAVVTAATLVSITVATTTQSNETHAGSADAVTDYGMPIAPKQVYTYGQQAKASRLGMPDLAHLYSHPDCYYCVAAGKRLRILADVEV